MLWFTRNDCETENEAALSSIRQCPNQLGSMDKRTSVHGICKLFEKSKKWKNVNPAERKSPLLHQLAFSYRRRTWRTPEEDLKKPKKVFEDNFRREDDEEELKKKIKWLANFPLCQIKRSFLTRSAVPGFGSIRTDGKMFYLKRDPAATSLNKLKLYL